MEKTCYEIQKDILTQKTASEVFNNQIDIHQEEATTKLKQLIVQDHFLSQRFLITEIFKNKAIEKPLELSAFSATENDVEANFASIDLPDDISKGPMKAFLNSMFDNLDSFLPLFYKLNFSNFSKSNLPIKPDVYLLRCVFPSMFGYCWSEESSTAYGHYLAMWFKGIYQESPELLKNFHKHWLSQAIRGFYLSIDINPFIKEALQPIFFDFVQLENKNTQNDPENLVKFAIRIVDSIHQNYPLLPNCLNVFFGELLECVGEENQQNLLIRYIFFDLFIVHCFKNPILNSVSDVLLPHDDYHSFINIYTIFRIKFAACKEKEKPLVDKILNVPEFALFNPFIIKDDMVNKRAMYKLPLLQKFCNIVQCAHQPLIMTTHYLAMLFRFGECLQASKALPKALERPLGTIIQESIAEKLENLPDHLFWFPCYALTYVNVPPINFIKESKTTPLYRLLSSADLRISPFDKDPLKALENAGEAATLTTHPEIKTEITWLLKNSPNAFSHIDEEIAIKQEEIESKRLRTLDLCSFAQTIQEQISNIPQGAQRSIATALLPEFIRYSKQDIQSKLFMLQVKSRIEEFCGNAFSVIGHQIAECILVEVTPCVKYAHEENISFEGDSDEMALLRSTINKPVLSSSFFSTATKLLPSLYTLKEYEKLSGTGETIKNIFKDPFIPHVDALASSFVSLLFPLPTELLTLVFSQGDLELLKIFSNAFNKKQ